MHNPSLREDKDLKSTTMKETEVYLITKKLR